MSDSCSCGHVKDRHDYQVGECYESGCDCRQFVERFWDLAEHDRQVAAMALREAANHLTVKTVDPAYVGDNGQFANGFYVGVRGCRHALRTLADQIEKEG